MGDELENTFEREREIYFAALEKKTEGSRSAYLWETCGEDATMLARVREMLVSPADGHLVVTPQYTSLKQARIGAPAYFDTHNLRVFLPVGLIYHIQSPR